MKNIYLTLIMLNYVKAFDNFYFYGDLFGEYKKIKNVKL